MKESQVFTLIIVEMSFNFHGATDLYDNMLSTSWKVTSSPLCSLSSS